VAVKSLTAKYVQGLPPVADAFEGTVSSDIINLRDWGHVEFIVVRGVGVTGSSTLTVEACDDVSASNVSALPFRYRESGANTDVFGALTEATSSGFVNTVTTTGSNRITVIEVDAEALGASGYGYVRLKTVQSVDSPVLGGILVRLSEPRFSRATDVTDIV
jgi:hypothetical protein